MHSYTQRGSALSLELQERFKADMLKQLEKKPWIADHRTSSSQKRSFHVYVEVHYHSNPNVLCVVPATYAWTGILGSLMRGQRRVPVSLSNEALM